MRRRRCAVPAKPQRSMSPSHRKGMSEVWEAIMRVPVQQKHNAEIEMVHVKLNHRRKRVCVHSLLSQKGKLRSMMTL